jgi:hypothetical protein
MKSEQARHSFQVLLDGADNWLKPIGIHMRSQRNEI